MNRHIEDGLLQDFLEGLLDPPVEEDLRGHLDSCPVCRDRAEGLTSLLDGLGALPVEAHPPRDLWPQIAWRMEGVKSPESSQDAGAQPHAVTDSVRGGRRISLPAWQLLAASIALMVVSGTTVWAFLSGGGEGVGTLGPALESPAQFVGWEETYGGYDEAVTDLEAVLEKGREILDPETVRVLEENLHTIDQAILEAESALTNDPASPVLQRFLADNLRKKVDLLRRAAGAVYAIT